MHNIDEHYLLEKLQALLDIPSPSGYCHDVMSWLEKEVRALGFPITFTRKGGAIITLPSNSTLDYTLCLTAHVDTLGAMVRSITSNGTLKLTSIGGFMMHSIEGEYCKVHTRDGKAYTGTILSTEPSVHVYREARDQKRVESNMEVRIDEVVKNAEDVEKLGITVGDYISFDARTQVLDSGYIKSRHLDDKASVAALLALIEWIKRENITLTKQVKIFISNYEEVGHGSSYIPTDIDEMIAVDMGAIGDDLSCSEHDVSICAKDSTGPYDYNMTTRLVELAKRDQLSYVVDIYPFYGSDASAALAGGHNIKAALIGPGVHASHSMERTHKQAIVHTAALLAAYVLD
ncbi:M42 family metallopeptidase [Longirhabdus pacifica]|uniref:M42 family metallopeptidase n=1 Tax=Longirhabdus pacifica TaxID=2305227 RepID=UPI001008F48B|nr:M42 family metallopeptidase [Longirhabdus pacifica]